MQRSADAGAKRSNRPLILLTLSIAVLVAQIDTSVVNLATRPIGAYFGASVAALQWVVDSYNLVYAILLLTGGLLADLYGRRRTFLIGLAVFTAASIICGLATSVSWLVAGRVFAGIGAALLLPASLAIIRVIWPAEQERAQVLGIWAACNGVALAIGPTAGGVLIHMFGWRSIFFVVVPFGLTAIALAMLALPESSDPRDRDFDAAAQLLGAVVLGGIALAAIECRSHLLIALAAFLAAAMALLLFVRVEARRGAAALVPLDIFRAAQFRGAVTATAGMTFGMYGVLFLVPLTWQATGRLDEIGTGLALLPMATIFVLISPFSGSLGAKLGIRNMTAGGVLLIGVGLLTIGVSAPSSRLWPTEVGLALTGLGMGIATGPLMGAAVGAVAAARSGTAAALINVARMAGATIGVAALGAVFALAGAGDHGLRAAMLLGGLIQIASASIAWATIRLIGEGDL